MRAQGCGRVLEMHNRHTSLLILHYEETVKMGERVQNCRNVRRFRFLWYFLNIIDRSEKGQLSFGEIRFILGNR